MKHDIENDPEWCGWLRRNDPEVTIREEARQVVGLVDELMHEPVTPYPHENALMTLPARPAKFWRGLFWALAFTLAGALVVWLSVKAL